LEQFSPAADAEDALLAPVATADELVSPAPALALALTSPLPLADADVLDPLAPALALTLASAPALTLVPPALTVTEVLFDVVALVDWA
jgi:hypothetical protein